MGWLNEAVDRQQTVFPRGRQTEAYRRSVVRDLAKKYRAAGDVEIADRLLADLDPKPQAQAIAPAVPKTPETLKRERLERKRAERRDRNRRLMAKLAVSAHHREELSRVYERPAEEEPILTEEEEAAAANGNIIEAALLIISTPGLEDRFSALYAEALAAENAADKAKRTAPSTNP